jgi:hypothetical protein
MPLSEVTFMDIPAPAPAPAAALAPAPAPRRDPDLPNSFHIAMQSTQKIFVLLLRDLC